MKKLSNYEELGIIIGRYYHLSSKHLASYFNISPNTINGRLNRLKKGDKYSIAMSYLKAAEPHYEECAEVLFDRNVRGMKSNDGIDKVVKSFGLNKSKIYRVEKDILNLKIKVLHST